MLTVTVPKTGRYKVKVAYLGDEHTTRGEDGTRLRVR